MTEADTHHDHDDHHGHIQLEYEPCLPLRNGKVCLWLFLSTEIMFFAGLIGTYNVLRFGAPARTWPTPNDVKVFPKGECRLSPGKGVKALRWNSA